MDGKVLYISRHAKSSWDDASLADFDRPLNKRGKKDAPMMGELLESLGVLPELIIASPAKRAIRTARILADKILYPASEIVLNEDIYEASTSDLLDIIENFDDSLKSVMIVGHNPSFTHLANYLTETYFDNVPTCGIVAVGFELSHWKDIDKNSGKIIFYEYPKKHK